MHIGIRPLLESSEEKTIRVTILICNFNALRWIFKLSTDERELFVLNAVVKLVMIPVFIPLVLVANNRNLSVAAIFEVERSKLHFFANQCTIG